MSYLTIKDTVSEEFEEKKSIFIGHAKRVYSEEEAKTFVSYIRSIHKQANHNVFAYIIGENMGIQRYSDDGEPQGTAGIPVIEVIKKNEVTDIAVVVTRYFGGVLLGAGGLVRAYSKAAAAAIKSAGIVEKVKGCVLFINIEYELLGKIQYICTQNFWHIEDIEYSDKVKLKLYLEEKLLDIVKNKVIEASSARAVLSIEEQDYYFKLGSRLFKDC